MASNENKPVATKVFYTLGAVLMVLAVLRFGQPVLVPVALSVLLAFILTPLVDILERWKLPRTPAVLIATGLAFALIAVAGWALAFQVRQLAADLPNHTQEIQAKVASLRASENSTLGRLTKMFNEIFPDQSAPGDQPADAAQTIVVAQEPASQLANATNMLVPILGPLATAGLVIVLVMFLLLRREDVRYRMISLMGDAALTGTTRLMRDTAERVSRYLLNLLLINASFGLWFGLGLYLMDVPYAPLWGFLTLVLRFIPFLGSPASVLFPLMISIATSSGWSQPIWLVVFFTLSELLTSNIIEPVLFGKTTGLTPIALLIAALFWAWVWGPVGLLLSTPLTVCMVVLGQHLPHFRSLKVLLAEQPVLDARLQFFQRLLAQDFAEGQRVFQQYAAEFGQAKAYDEVLVPALRWTRRERAKESISAAEEQFIWQATRDSIANTALATVAEDAPIETQPRGLVYGYPVHHETEEIALAMLGELIGSDCEVILRSTKILPSKAISEIQTLQPAAVVLAVLPPGGLPQVEYMCKEIRSRCDQVPIVVAFLDTPKGYDDMLVRIRQAGGSYLTTSLAQTHHQLDVLMPEATAPPRPESNAEAEAAATEVEQVPHAQ